MGLTIEDLNNIKKLREITGSKLMVCKKAYIESEKIFDDALNLLKTDDRFSGVQLLVYHKPIKNNESEELKMREEKVPEKKCHGESMFGRCDCCGKDAPLRRTYFRYPDIPCTCHSPEHFIIRNHCKDCTPIEPEYTKVEFRTADLKNPIAMAMNIITNALNEDKSEGSYYYSWQANIACAIMDTSKDITHEDANKAAKMFLDRLAGDKMQQEQSIENKVYIFQDWNIFSQSIDDFKKWDIVGRILPTLHDNPNLVYRHTDNNHNAFIYIYH